MRVLFEEHEEDDFVDVDGTFGLTLELLDAVDVFFACLGLAFALVKKLKVDVCVKLDV